MTSYSDRVTHLQSFLADRPGSTTSYNAEAVLLSDVKALAEDADRDLDNAVGRFNAEYEANQAALHRIFELEALVAEKDSQIAELQAAYDALTGEKFSDRVHVALKQRAEAAEDCLAELTTERDDARTQCQRWYNIVANNPYALQPSDFEAFAIWLRERVEQLSAECAVDGGKGL